MKTILTISSLILSITGSALAGNNHDQCMKEEKALRAQEAGDCSGLKYLLNPSGCFATRKALKEYTSGKCKKIGLAEHGTFKEHVVIPEKKISTVDSISVKKLEPAVSQQESTLDQLKEENRLLKTEISRLREENEHLRKVGR